MTQIVEYVSRDSTLLDACVGKRVLHIGCVGFTDCTADEKVLQAKGGLHYALSQVSDCIGIDNDSETVDLLSARGVFSNIKVGDAESLHDLPDLGIFDVILASDIIEHLSNPGRMLDGVKQFMGPHSTLIVSCPNAFSLPSFVRFASGRFREGLQHVLSFNSINLAQLLFRHGFHVERAYTGYQSIAVDLNGPLFWITKPLLSAFPKYGGTLIFFAHARHPSFP